MSVEFLILAIFVVGWCWGFHNAFRDGEIFGVVGNWLRAHLPAAVLDPTIECPICMASIHGTTWFLLLHEWYFLPWIMFIVAVSGFNYVIHILSDK